MNKKSNFLQAMVGALVLTLGLLPVAALARDNEGAGASLQVNVSARVEADDREDLSADSTTTVRMREEDESEIESEIENEIEVDHDSAKSASSTIKTPERVSNRGELRSFLNHIVKGDDRIADVHISSTTIETRYDMPAKFLWSIPTKLTANISIDSEGSVSVKYPWYAFLFAKHDSDLAAQLEQSASTTASTSFSANTQAHLLNLIFSILKGSAQE